MASSSSVGSALIIDPDPTSRRVYADYLRRALFDVDELSDGRDALARALTQHYDAIVTETRLPGINGFALCELLKSDTATATIPVVFVTGTQRPDDIERARHSGADGILIKPCLPEALALELGRVLHRSHELKERALHVLDRASVQLDRAERVVQKSQRVRGSALNRLHHRGVSTSPPIPPPELRCPSCDATLTYQRSQLGGVNERHTEQWDYYECAAGCGSFQYRQRTRRIRRVF